MICKPQTPPLAPSTKVHLFKKDDNKTVRKDAFKFAREIISVDRHQDTHSVQ